MGGLDLFEIVIMNLVDPIFLMRISSSYLDADMEKVVNWVHLGLGFCYWGDVVIQAMHRYSVLY